MDQNGEARAEGILAELERNGRVSVNELADRLGVSAVTIRKDLESLERRSLLRRVRGGAVLVAPAEEGSFADRLRRDAGAKKAIARRAATLVSDGQVIALDSSTTAYFLAIELLGRRDLIVVTHSLRIATLLSEESNATVVMPGGVVRRASASTVGPIADVLAGRGRLQLGFFGAASVSPTLGLLELASPESDTKRILVDACDEVVGILDASKFRGFGLHSFAHVDELDRIITDDRVADEVVAEWEAAGVTIERCSPLLAVTDAVETPSVLTDEEAV